MIFSVLFFLTTTSLSGFAALKTLGISIVSDVEERAAQLLSARLVRRIETATDGVVRAIDLMSMKGFETRSLECQRLENLLREPASEETTQEIRALFEKTEPRFLCGEIQQRSAIEIGKRLPTEQEKWFQVALKIHPGLEAPEEWELLSERPDLARHFENLRKKISKPCRLTLEGEEHGYLLNGFQVPKVIDVPQSTPFVMQAFHNHRLVEMRTIRCLGLSTVVHTRRSRINVLKEVAIRYGFDGILEITNGKKVDLVLVASDGAHDRIEIAGNLSMLAEISASRLPFSEGWFLAWQKRSIRQPSTRASLSAFWGDKDMRKVWEFGRAKSEPNTNKWFTNKWVWAGLIAAGVGIKLSGAFNQGPARTDITGHVE
jgi:hypothetical protein